MTPLCIYFNTYISIKNAFVMRTLGGTKSVGSCPPGRAEKRNIPSCRILRPQPTPFIVNWSRTAIKSFPSTCQREEMGGSPRLSYWFQVIRGKLQCSSMSIVKNKWTLAVHNRIYCEMFNSLIQILNNHTDSISSVEEIWRCF
jgi:hypothetical protein